MTIIPIIVAKNTLVALSNLHCNLYEHYHLLMFTDIMLLLYITKPLYYKYHMSVTDKVFYRHSKGEKGVN